MTYNFKWSNGNIIVSSHTLTAEAKIFEKMLAGSLGNYLLPGM